jgi:SAM-dependent methyltransferase
VTAFGLVVPLYDEAARIGEFGPELLGFVARAPADSELVFVDDGSTDGTPELVDELLAHHPAVAARLLRRPHRGKGAAVTAGLAEVRAPWAGFCDVDLSTPLDQLEKVVHAATRGRVLAIGSRDVTGSRLLRPESPVREALGRTYNRLLQATITPGVLDTQCGAKFAATDLWHLILPECREPGYAWDAEVIAIARAVGVPVREVPIEWRHDDRSRVHVVRDGAAMVAATARIWRNVRRVRADRPTPSPALESAAAGADGGVFDEENARLLGAADTDHWWFRSKAAFVATALRRTSDPGAPGGWLLDAGAGAGGVSAQLGWDSDRVVVVEGNATLARQAHAAHGLLSAQSRVDRLPFADGSLAVVCLLDVIEHLPRPGAALAEARRVLAPGGRLIVNVPAHQWLWSAADEFLGHERRYTRRMLAGELAAAGFRPAIVTHTFSWLVAPVYLTRRVASGDAELGLDRSSTLIDIAAIVLTRLERSLIGRVPLPLGTSVLAVARPEPSAG